MTELEKRKREERLLRESRPELRDKAELVRFRQRKRQKSMSSALVILGVAVAVALLLITRAVKERHLYLQPGIPAGYWIACVLALVLTLLQPLILRRITARREAKEEGAVALLTEEELIREGRDAPLASIAAYGCFAVLLVLWLLHNRLPEPAATLAVPFIVPIAVLFFVINLLLPLGAARKAARLARAIEDGDYQITAELLCDKEHIVERGRKDENDTHYYYLFFRSGPDGEVKREQVFSRDYDGVEIGQIYYRFRQGTRVLKTLPRQTHKLDAALGRHLQPGQDWTAEPVSLEDEEIRRQVDRLRVGEAPEKELGPVPEDMDPREVEQKQAAAAALLRKYDAVRNCTAVCAVLNLLLIVAARILRHLHPRTNLMGSSALLGMLLAALLAGFLALFLMIRSIGYLKQARDAFPFENEEFRRREASQRKTVLFGIAGFLLLFAAVFAMIF